MPGSELIQSLTRGLRVLEAVAGSEDGLSVGEIASLLEVKPPTAHNIIRTLAERGYLDRRERPVRYALGRAALELAYRNQRDRLRRHAGMVLQELAREQPGATLTLMEAAAGDIVVNLRVSPDRPGLLQHPTSQTMRPYSSASSLVFQAYWAPVDRADYRARHPFAEFAPASWRSEDQLDAFLDQAKVAGCVVLTEGALCRVAAPVFDQNEQIIAAVGLSVPGPLAATSQQRIIRLIKAAADRIGSVFKPEEQE